MPRTVSLIALTIALILNLGAMIYSIAAIGASTGPALISYIICPFILVTIYTQITKKYLNLNYVWTGQLKLAKEILNTLMIAIFIGMVIDGKNLSAYIPNLFAQITTAFILNNIVSLNEKRKDKD
jgi:hypothetical protein